MSNTEISANLKKYQKASANSKARRSYFSAFEKKMIYRTTKTENPQTTMGMVNKVLNKLAIKTS
ncbi:MAG: hypothetical protein UT42_C0002G0004 [Candidatus Falkowbacteria bacterium GW2011_GWA2_39_24]|uniref:Uncharacterized protein n=1 Tax=Candidatus Falkowbacteria bacterium GW2011_GWA2_39_24 TaxID=1618634 RepID=A0A0G0NIU1_9BACT|nr:MAG: hypothetical protein UT42_C0002G0004 [Candidatus Falkowbacteria bacterium GW2011_GWA2_39_24]